MSNMERSPRLTHHQDQLADDVARAWREIALGREADMAEFREEGRKRDVARRVRFQEALKSARQFGVPWAKMVERGVSKPTLYKYGKGKEDGNG